jgi:Flp pilus assembly protein TadB
MPTAPGAGWEMPTIAVVVAILALIAIADLSLRWFVRREARRRRDRQTAAMAPGEEVFT